MSNPAETLYQHFQTISAIDTNTRSWADAWRDVTGMPWTKAVEPLLSLITRSERMVLAHPHIDAPMVLHHEPEWRRAILLNGVNQDAAMSASGLTSIDRSAMAGLYSLSAIIAGLPETTRSVPDDQLTNLANAIAALREDVVGATDVDRELREFLLVEIARIQDRLDRARVTGTGPVEDLVEEIVGSGARHSIMWQKVMASSLRERVVAVFIAFQAIIGTIDTTVATIESAADHVNGVVTVVEQIFTDPPRQIAEGKAPLQLAPGTPGGPDEPERVEIENV